MSQITPFESMTLTRNSTDQNYEELKHMIEQHEIKIVNIRRSQGQLIVVFRRLQ
jgi:hypothetical protein